MLLSLRKNGLTSLFKEVRVFKVVMNITAQEVAPGSLLVNNSARMVLRDPNNF